MNPVTSVRLDRWLWAVRLYKTRSLATDACKAGHVEIDGAKVKPASDVKIGETITALTGDIRRTYRVISLLDQRVGAARVKEFAEDLTPASEFEKKREPSLQPVFFRPKGSGRPTKRDRRKMEELF
jgi:ribosome-associated heat shock protein Hsp15